MIATWMLYCTAVSLLLGLAALALEHGFRVRDWSVRWVWVVSLATSLFLPVVGWLAPSAGDPRSTPGPEPVLGNRNSTDPRLLRSRGYTLSLPSAVRRSAPRVLGVQHSCGIRRPDSSAGSRAGADELAPQVGCGHSGAGFQVYGTGRGRIPPSPDRAPGVGACKGRGNPASRG